MLTLCHGSQMGEQPPWREAYFRVSGNNIQFKLSNRTSRSGSTMMVAKNDKTGEEVLRICVDGNHLDFSLDGEPSDIGRLYNEHLEAEESVDYYLDPVYEIDTHDAKGALV